MREAGIASKQPRGHRYRIAEEESIIAPNHLARKFTVSKANQVWCGDVTYVWSGKQWLYLAVVLDLYKRRVVGWACSTSPDSQLTIQALRMACLVNTSDAADELPGVDPGGRPSITKQNTTHPDTSTRPS